MKIDCGAEPCGLGGTGMTIDFLDESVTIAQTLDRRSDHDMVFIEARLRAVATRAGNDALEKAAEECERIESVTRYGVGDRAPSRCAKAIRALKVKP